MPGTTIYTIGWQLKNTHQFVNILKDASIEQVIDVRLWNSAQNKPTFSGARIQKTLKESGIEYLRFKNIREPPILAPSPEILNRWKIEKGRDIKEAWGRYVATFVTLWKGGGSWINWICQYSRSEQH